MKKLTIWIFSILLIVNLSWGEKYDGIPKSKEVYTRTLLFTLPWGSKDGEMGKADDNSTGPTAIAIDNSAHIYINDIENRRVQKFDQQGNFIQFIQLTGYPFPGRYFCVDNTGNIHFFNYGDSHRFYNSKNLKMKNKALPSIVSYKVNGEKESEKKILKENNISKDEFDRSEFKVNNGRLIMNKKYIYFSESAITDLLMKKNERYDKKNNTYSSTYNYEDVYGNQVFRIDSSKLEKQGFTLLNDSQYLRLDKHENSYFFITLRPVKIDFIFKISKDSVCLAYVELPNQDIFKDDLFDNGMAVMHGKYRFNIDNFGNIYYMIGLRSGLKVFKYSIKR